MAIFRRVRSTWAGKIFLCPYTELCNPLISIFYIRNISKFFLQYLYWIISLLSTYFPNFQIWTWLWQNLEHNSRKIIKSAFLPLEHTCITLHFLSSWPSNIVNKTLSGLPEYQSLLSLCCISSLSSVWLLDL